MDKGDHRDAKPVHDLDEVALIRVVKSLQAGVDMAGFELTGSPKMTIGCTIAPSGDDEALDKELELAREKVEAGAQFVISPSVFDIKRFSSFMEKAKALGVPIIPTVFLLKSVGIARYMATYEPGVHISEDLIKRIRKSSDRELECIRIAGETIAELKKIAQGVRIQTLGWEHRLPAILDYAEI
jgi:5,10-methylenetetrahydrofolate reductase